MLFEPLKDDWNLLIWRLLDSLFLFCLLQMAYESLALVSNALSRLEAGQIGVCR